MSGYGDVLLVEDNQADVRLTMHILSEIRNIHRVQVARDGEQALNLIFGADHVASKAPVAVFTLVLLDLKLPKINGVEVLKELKENEATKAMPVVVFSSSRQVSDVDRCYQLGANGYVQKPVAFEHFEDMVRRIADFWLGANLTASPAAFCELVSPKYKSETGQT